MNLFGNAQKGDASLFERYTIHYDKKLGEGGYGAAFRVTEKASGE